MSYCVNCGVELDETASFCPLCHTPVYNPNQPVNEAKTKTLSHRAQGGSPSSKLPIAILISTVLASVAVCCGILNLFLKTQHTWSLYVIGAAIMLWIWTVPLCSTTKRIPFVYSYWQMSLPSPSMSPSSQWIWMDGIGTCTWRAHHSPAGCLVPVLGIDYGGAKTEHPILHRIGDRLLRGVYVGGRGAD